MRSCYDYYEIMRSFIRQALSTFFTFYSFAEKASWRRWHEIGHGLLHSLSVFFLILDETKRKRHVYTCIHISSVYSIVFSLFLFYNESLKVTAARSLHDMSCHYRQGTDTLTSS